MPYVLRDHQEEAIQRLADSFRSGKRRPVLQAATGFGKTVVAMEIIQRALDKGKRVLFSVDRITLIEQTSAEFDKAGLDHGIIQGDHWRSNSMMQLQIGSVQTISRRHKAMAPDFDLIINDECHSLNKGYLQIMDSHWRTVPTIGLSATPWTRNLGKIYDDLIVVRTTDWLIKNGYLSDYVAYGGSAPDLKGVKTSAGDFNQKELGQRVNKPSIVGDIVSTYQRLGQGQRAVCFAVNVAHSKAIVDSFMAHGIPAAHIDAHTPHDERERILYSHQREGGVLSNVGITTKGWDSPGTNCLIYARPTKSLMLHYQIMGRVLRVSPCGSQAIILDHGGNMERLGFPDSPTSEYLCQGNIEETKAKREEVKEPTPMPCKGCLTLFVGFKCPTCGLERRKKANVEVKKGELKKLDKATANEKQRWYGMLLGYTRSKGWSDGAASHMYRDKFAVWPAKKAGVPAIRPNEEVMRYIQHRNIKRAKARA